MIWAPECHCGKWNSPVRCFLSPSLPFSLNPSLLLFLSSFSPPLSSVLSLLLKVYS